MSCLSSSEIITKTSATTTTTTTTITTTTTKATTSAAELVEEGGLLVRIPREESDTDDISSAEKCLNSASKFGITLWNRLVSHEWVEGKEATEEIVFAFGELPGDKCGPDEGVCFD